MEPTTTEPEQEETGSTHARMGHVRWTICALIFAATTLNCMDRMALGILKPTIQQSIGRCQAGYGWVVVAFQIAYAAGMLIMGRFIDRVGTALADSVMEFAVARFFLGLGESGNFPVAIKMVSEWFPQGERSPATGLCRTARE